MTATDSRVTTWHVCFDDEDTGGLPAGQRQAWCVRDFPGHVASRVDAIFPERPCGRVLGAASSDRNVRNRQSDCSAVCRLPATRCLDVAGYCVTTFGRGDYLAGPSRGDGANRAGGDSCLAHCPCGVCRSYKRLLRATSRGDFTLG
jgi:hypothetical protein